MSEVTIEQATYRRDRHQPPRLLARTPGLDEGLFGPIEEMLMAFGERPAGVACPGAVFAQPLGRDHVAVVHVRDGEPGADGWAELRYHLLVLTANDYDRLGGDPFALAGRLDATEPLSPLRLPGESLSPRSLEKIRAVLQRTKAGVGKVEELTVENSESPTLLGGVQTLVDGGKLAFERPRPDAAVIESLWTLLPHKLRPRLWPASFAFENELGFDVLVAPKLDSLPLDGYTTEAQAGDYPAGSYELSLQTATEAGDERGLAAVLHRRSSNDTLRLAAKLLVGMCLLVLASQILMPKPRVDLTPRAAAVAGIVGVRDPWTALTMLDHGKRMFDGRR